MPQTAQILVSTFKIFRGSMPSDLPRYFCFSFNNSQVLGTKIPILLSFAVADRLKSMLYQNVYIVLYRRIPTDCSCQMIREFC